MEDLIIDVMAGGILLAFLGGIFGWFILTAIGRWRIFVKCGYPGWKALIPLYSSYIFMTEICEIHWGISFLYLAAICGMIEYKGVGYCVASICYGFALYNFAKKINKEPILVGLLGGLFKMLMTLVLGFFIDYEYDPDEPVSPFGPIEEH